MLLPPGKFFTMFHFLEVSPIFQGTYYRPLINLSTHSLVARRILFRRTHTKPPTSVGNPSHRARVLLTESQTRDS